MVDCLRVLHWLHLVHFINSVIQVFKLREHRAIDRQLIDKILNVCNSAI